MYWTETSASFVFSSAYSNKVLYKIQLSKKDCCQGTQCRLSQQSVPCNVSGDVQPTSTQIEGLLCLRGSVTVVSYGHCVKLGRPMFTFIKMHLVSYERVREECRVFRMQGLEGRRVSTGHFEISAQPAWLGSYPTQCYAVTNHIAQILSFLNPSSTQRNVDIQEMCHMYTCV